MGSLFHNPAKNVVKDPLSHTFHLAPLQGFWPEGEQTLMHNITGFSAFSHPRFWEQWRRSLNWERVSQEAIWALLRSPVSQLLNPVKHQHKASRGWTPHWGYLWFSFVEPHAQEWVCIRWLRASYIQLIVIFNNPVSWNNGSTVKWYNPSKPTMTNVALFPLTVVEKMENLTYLMELEI